MSTPIVAGALQSATRESLASQCAAILKRYILTERLEPGDRLPAERRLAETLNVSRTVLREALNQLVGEGLVKRELSRTPVVADFDRTRLAYELSALDDRNAEVRDFIQLRVILELGAIETIVERMSDEDLAELERWVTELERSVEHGEPTSAADLGFHTALLRILGNAAVDDLLPLIEETMRQNLTVNPRELRGVTTLSERRAVAQHRGILEALRGRDGTKARKLMAAHLDPYLHPERYLAELASDDAGPDRS